MQTLRTGCSKAEPKIFAPPLTLPGCAGQPKFNQLEMVTIFTCRPSLVEDRCTQFRVIVVIDPQTNKHTHTHKQTGPITIHCATKLSTQRNYHQNLGAAAAAATATTTTTTDVTNITTATKNHHSGFLLNIHKQSKTRHQS